MATLKASCKSDFRNSSPFGCTKYQKFIRLPFYLIKNRSNLFNLSICKGKYLVKIVLFHLKRIFFWGEKA